MLALHASVLSSGRTVFYFEIDEPNVSISVKISPTAGSGVGHARHRSPMSLDLLLWAQERGPPSAWAAAAARRPRRPSWPSPMIAGLMCST